MKNFRLFNKLNIAMINYNSCIDTFASRTQNSSPTYTVMKKPVKTRPRFHYSHESVPIPRPEEFIPPVITYKKPLNQSPRRIINISLTIPNASQRFGRNFSLDPIIDGANLHSYSIDYPRAPIVSSKPKHKVVPAINPMLHFENYKMPRDSSLLQINSVNLKNRAKSLIRNSSLSLSNTGLFNMVTSFQRYIESNYKKMYEEIDIAQKGYITVDDFINLVMFIDLIHSNNTENFELVKSKAEDIFSVFSTVSSTNKVTRKDFYAVCSLYEQVKTTHEVLNLLDSNSRALIRAKVEETSKIFKCYSKNGRIKLKDLHNVLKLLHMDDLQLIESMLFLEVIDLSCFLRFLPLFSWMHENVIKSLDFNN